MKQSERLYRWLLRFYPREFREEYEQEMALVFRGRAADGLVTLWWQIAGDLLLHAPREHWNAVRQDLRYAFRQMRRTPGFSGIVIATLALGIGGTTAVFTLLQAVLFAPLPFDEPGQLVRFYQQEPDRPATRNYLTGAHFSALREAAASFESMTALANYRETGRDLVVNGEARRLRVLRVTSDYFHTLRGGSVQGPAFERGDETGARRVVIGRTLWRSAFGSHPSIVGTAVRLSGEPYEIVGIAPDEIGDPIAGRVDAWVPYNLAQDTDAENNSLSGIGRLKNGVTLAQAGEELAGLSRAMKERFPAARTSAVVAVPLQDDLVAHSRGPLYLLLGAVGLVLMVACVNVANLVLTRTAGRIHEFAIRSALGSGRSRLVRQMLVEMLVLAVLGGALGIGLAFTAVNTFVTLARDAFPRVDQVGFEPVVLLFAAGVTMLTAIACGVAPALGAGRVSAASALRTQARSTTSRRQQRLRAGLAAAQLALALTLLIGAGALLASLFRLQRVNLGFHVDQVLTFEVNLPSVRYDAARRAEFQELLAQRLESIPGVTAAGAISFLPAAGSFHPWNTHLVTGPRAGEALGRQGGYTPQQRVISGDAFGALGIPILAGRAFGDQDHANAPPRAIVSANFARAAYPGLPLDGALGQLIRAGGRRNMEIVGVVGDVALDVYGTPTLGIYHAHRQFADDRNWALSQVVAGPMPPERLIADVRAVVAAMDPELVVYRAAPMSDVVGRGASRERFALVLMGAFAAVSLLLAALGLYGVLADSVRQRTREIGIRIALGATTAQIRRLVLRQAAVILVVGVIAGSNGAVVLGRWLTTLLFETRALDSRVVVATATLLTITGLVAAWLPARRAARVEPRVTIQEG